jgi:hypothetical protein
VCGYGSVWVWECVSYGLWPRDEGWLCHDNCTRDEGWPLGVGLQERHTKISLILMTSYFCQSLESFTDFIILFGILTPGSKSPQAALVKSHCGER